MSVTARPIDPPSVPLPDSVDADVLIFPREVIESDGLYDDSALTLAKELRKDGVTAEYQHGPGSRQWIGERGVDIVLSLILGIASNAGWDALCGLLRLRHPSDSVRITLARCRQTESGVEWEWFEAEGPGEDVARALEQLGAKVESAQKE